jgi:hypothetical protein
LPSPESGTTIPASNEPEIGRLSGDSFDGKG